MTARTLLFTLAFALPLIFAVAPARAAQLLNVTWQNSVNGATTSSGDPNAATGPLPGGASGGIVLSDAVANFGLLDVHARGELSAVNFSGYYTGATVDAEWLDTITVTPSTAGTLTGSFRITGTTALSGYTEQQAGSIWGYYVSMGASVVQTFGSPGRGIVSGIHFDNSPLDGSPLVITIDLALLSGPTTFDIFARAQASANFTLTGGTVSGVADSDFTLEWLGMTFKDAQNVTQPFTTSSSSGFNYAQAVPEPSSWLAVCGGSALLLGFRRHRVRFA